MHRISLMDTDLSYVEFKNVDWWEFKGAYMTIDQAVLLVAENEKFARKYYEWAVDSSSTGLLAGLLREVLAWLRAALWRLVLLPRLLLKLVRSIRRAKREAVERMERWRRNVQGAMTALRLRIGAGAFIVVPRSITLDNVLQELRNLRDWHDRKMRYEEGGRFFISEMDTKRLVGPRAAQQGAKGGRLKRFAFWLERLIITLYRWLCLYGESMARPLIGILLALFAFAIFYALFPPSVLTGLPGFPGLFSSPLQLLASLYKGFELSLSALLQVPPPTFEASIVAERALSVLLMGSFLTALKRKLERRVRRGG